MINNDNDLFRELNLKKRKPVNIVSNLVGRELGLYSPCAFQTLYTGHAHKNECTVENSLRHLYLAVYPNFTIMNVRISNCFLRHFSPDGRFLVGFNQSLNGIQIFAFKGSSAGLNDPHFVSASSTASGESASATTSAERAASPPSSSSSSSREGERRTAREGAVTSRIARLNSDKTDSENLRHRAFDIYFKEIANMRLVEANSNTGTNNESMNRECALFYQDYHMIVASSELVSDDNLPPYDQMVTNNEAIHFNIIENYTIYLVNLKDAKLCDKLVFKADKINLTHNQGLGLFKNIFVVLSQQNQTIYVYNIIPNYYLNYDDRPSTSTMGAPGLSPNTSRRSRSSKSAYKFVLVHQIGRFCMPDDGELFKNPMLFMQSMFTENGHQHQNGDHESSPKRSKESQTTPESLNSLHATVSARGHQATGPSRNTSASSNSSSSNSSNAATSGQTFSRQYHTRHFSHVTHQRHINDQQNLAVKGFSEACYTSMKQRILTYFYRESLENNTLNQFYAFFNNIVNLKMYRMQLLDDKHLLIKYVNGEQLVNQKLNSAAFAAMNAAAAAIAASITTGNRQPTGTASGAASSAGSTTTTTASTTTAPSGSAAVSSVGTNTSFILSGGQINSFASNLTNASTNASNPVIGNINIFSSSATIPVMLNEQQLFYFVLYNMKTGKILNIMRNTSPQLLFAYENFQDHFSLSALDNWTSDYNIPFINDSSGARPGGSSLNFHTLASNNVYARQTMQRHIKTMSKMNTPSELTKCLLAQLPLSSQSYTTSPYLDHSLFSYDEKLISNFERPKPIGDQVIKFNNRDTGHLLFRLYTGSQNQWPNHNTQSHSLKRLVAFIWHPREPFCISVQRAANEYNFNFHIYAKNHIV